MIPQRGTLSEWHHTHRSLSARSQSSLADQILEDGYYNLGLSHSLRQRLALAELVLLVVLTMTTDDHKKISWWLRWWGWGWWWWCRVTRGWTRPYQGLFMVWLLCCCHSRNVRWSVIRTPLSWHGGWPTSSGFVLLPRCTFQIVCHIFILTVYLNFSCFCYFLSLFSTAMLTCYIDIAILSVCLSVTFWYCIGTAQHIIILSSAYGNQIILVFPVINIFAKLHPYVE